jgi:RNA polymerase sigma-70 factor (ECF subfamily)
VEHYGGEILAFLIARMRGTSDGEEVFAAFAEKLWVGLPSFEWRCSLRSWAYRLARNAGNDYAGAAHNRPGRHVPVSQAATLSAAVERVRTTTALYRQTAAKDRVRALREALSPDDQMLLVLRVDRGMDFRELAAAMADGSEMLDGDALDKSAARLRKRFERVKERLRELARAEGLL